MEEIIPPSQLAALLQVNVKTVYRLAKKGAIPGNKIWRSWRFSKRDILNLPPNNKRKRLITERKRAEGQIQRQIPYLAVAKGLERPHKRAAPVQNSQQVEGRTHELSVLYAVTAAASQSAEALEFILCTGAYSERSIQDRPRVVLLDLTETTQSGWAGSAATHEGRPTHLGAPGGGAHLVTRGPRRCGELPIGHQQLYRQAGEFRKVHRGSLTVRVLLASA